MAEIQDSVGMKFVLKKKKMFLKWKQICIMYTQKPHKEKKWNEMKWTKVPIQLKKKIILRNLKLKTWEKTLSHWYW